MGEDPLQSLLRYVFGAGLGGVTAAALVWVARKLWRGDQIASADATGNITAVDKLLRINDAQQEDIAALRAALIEANARTDRAYDERNRVVEELGKLRGEVEALRMEVRMLRGERDEQTA